MTRLLGILARVVEVIYFRVHAITYRPWGCLLPHMHPSSFLVQKARANPSNSSNRFACFAFVVPLWGVWGSLSVNRARKLKKSRHLAHARDVAISRLPKTSTRNPIGRKQNGAVRDLRDKEAMLRWHEQVKGRMLSSVAPLATNMETKRQHTRTHTQNQAEKTNQNQGKQEENTKPTKNKTTQRKARTPRKTQIKTKETRKPKREKNKQQGHQEKIQTKTKDTKTNNQNQGSPALS